MLGVRTDNSGLMREDNVRGGRRAGGPLGRHSVNAMAASGSATRKLKLSSKYSDTVSAS